MLPFTQSFNYLSNYISSPSPKQPYGGSIEHFSHEDVYFSQTVDCELIIVVSSLCPFSRRHQCERNLNRGPCSIRGLIIKDLESIKKWEGSWEGANRRRSVEEGDLGRHSQIESLTLLLSVVSSIDHLEFLFGCYRFFK